MFNEHVNKWSITEQKHEDCCLPHGKETEDIGEVDEGLAPSRLVVDPDLDINKPREEHADEESTVTDG